MKNIYTIFIFLCLSVSAHAAWITNYPVEVKQPDGTVLNLFATGDEYHHRVHDAAGYTLLRNSEGWVVYATLKDGELVPTDIVYVQTTDGAKITKKAQDLGIEPNIDISAEKRRERYQNYVSKMEKPGVSGGPQNIQGAPVTLRTGTMNNIVVYIAFQGETFYKPQRSDYENLFMSNTSGESLFSYFRDISNNQFSLPSSFFPTQTGSSVVSYPDTHTRGYYLVYNAVTNPDGYPSESEGDLRLHALLYNALNYVKPEVEAQFTSDSQLDYDNNGFVDNICFVVTGSPGAWSDVLWPHRWSLYYAPEYVYFKGKRAWDYNLIIDNHLWTVSNGKQSVLVHETYHTLSAPDLYTGGTDNGPVSIWDVMASNRIPPQSSTVYISNKYGHFVDDIPEISASGEYTLYDTWDRTGNTIAYKIPSPTSMAGEYFVLEYRRRQSDGGTVYETYTPSSGIIIYRINPNVKGNMNANGTAASPYEMYVYRPNGTISGGGLISSAAFKQGGLTTFSDSSSPSAFLSDNSAGLGGIVIDQFSVAGGETMTFRVTFPAAGIPVATAASNIKRPGFTANWNPSTNTQSYQLSVYYKNGDTKIYTDGGFQDRDVSNVITYDVTGLDYTKATTWYYTVKAVSGTVPSGESNEIEVELAAYDGVTCEYESNILAGETAWNAIWGGNNGYISGHNNYGDSQFAEYYQLGAAKKISGFKVRLQALQKTSNNPDYAKVTVILWDKGANGQPNNVLYSEDFDLDRFTPGENTLPFTTSTIVPSEFFIGYKIYYAPTNPDVFAVSFVDKGTNPNFAYVYWNGTWDVLLSGYRTSLFLFPNVCTFAPEASFTVETPQTANIPVAFTNTSLEAPGTTWLWDFGDGQTSAEKNPTHTYTSAGTYTATLKAANTVGESTVTEEIVVYAPVTLTLAKGRNWYLSSPVTTAKANTTLAVANFVEYYDEPLTTPYSESDQTIDGWVNIAGSENTLVPGKGYVVYAEGTGDVTYTFIGAPTAGDIEVPLTRSAGVAKEGFNLVGNPYLSHIDWNAVSTANSFLEPTIWYRTKTDAYYFYTYNSESGLSDPDNLSYSLRYVPATQGFWVRALNAGTLTFTESAMVDSETAGNGNILKSPPTGSIRPLVRLQLTDGGKTDRAVIFADKNAKDGFDRYDSEKMFSSGAAIYTTAEKEKLIFNGLSAINADTEIPLGFSTNHSGEYSIAAIAVQDFDGIEVILKDNILNAEFSLTDGDAYLFSSDITDNISRFSVIFREQKDLSDTGDEVSVSASDNTLYVQSSIPVKRVQVYTLAGKLLYNTKESVIYNVGSGAYIVRVETENGTVSRKVIMR
ncbi:MAG: PKD domain-containing protein [Prevotella sp.]|jgi:M6 family metalloprotease-like protein|nr:PKD domain-containing protein [Prevotella sp.]